MLKRILIANRGEIAVRIIRCCLEMDIETVAVYSSADKNTLAVLAATESVCIGPARAADSYLQGDLIIEAARRTGCDAIHPGYGFLSENASFAEKCEKNGIVFIGPSADIIRRMGDKQAARALMIRAGVPVVPGSDGLIRSLEEALKAADRIGYPVLIKASAGGGGRGMRKVFSPDEMKQSLREAKAEAQAAFGSDDMYLEKLVQDPHHVEIQILADRKGHTIWLGERDCSIQRNNQKLLEEAPSPLLNEKLRRKMGKTAVKAAKAAGYCSAGTVEFLVDHEGNYYFIEMNTRIQVEHPVTEELMDIDLIREQIRIAAGMELKLPQPEVPSSRHVIECRINARNTGTVGFLHFPAGYGVRIESDLYSGCTISPWYDSMIAKIIVTGRTRLDTIRRLRRALEELVIEGVETNADFMHLLTYQPDFILGRYNTGFWDKNHREIEEWLSKGDRIQMHKQKTDSAEREQEP